jgi:hypothetical protein
LNDELRKSNEAKAFPKFSNIRQLKLTAMEPAEGKKQKFLQLFTFTIRG